ncbi:MAG: hypothetical protein HYW34_02675 [Candidatus Brennerbacteria bacterium]|nr:hypothetical protein [Candidatus Brennerbacteria bacterium]
MKRINLKGSKSRGTILVEVIIAISIVIVGLLAVLRLLSRSISLNREVSNQLVATYLAEEGIEVAKNILDANTIKIGIGDPPYTNSNQWNRDFTPGSYEIDYQSQALESDQGRFLFFDPDTGRYGYDTAVGLQTFFKRRIDIENITNNELRISSKVNWDSRSGAISSVDLEDHFYNWRCDYNNFPQCP